jgi:hypothetical protein
LRWVEKGKKGEIDVSTYTNDMSAKREVTHPFLIHTVSHIVALLQIVE